MMLKLKLQYFGHLMRRVDSLENTLMLEGLGAGGEGDDRGWDGWMASLTRWMWVWVNPGSWWRTGRPGVLRFMGLQRVGYDWATELNGLSWLKRRIWIPFKKYKQTGLIRGLTSMCPSLSWSRKLWRIGKDTPRIYRELRAADTYHCLSLLDGFFIGTLRIGATEWQCFALGEIGTPSLVLQSWMSSVIGFEINKQVLLLDNSVSWGTGS